MSSSYYVQGWRSVDCTGDSPVIEAYEPPNAECFHTGVNMGNIAQAQSFKFQQIPPP
jgi:hypothetical protein